MGWFGQSALLADRGGQGWSFQASECEVEQPDAQTVRFVLHDAVARIAVTTSYTLDPATDVMTVRTALSNEGAAPLHVHWLAAAALPLPEDAAEVAELGRWRWRRCRW